MKHVANLSRVRHRPLQADNIEDVAKVLDEVLTLIGEVLATVATWQNLQDTKPD